MIAGRVGASVHDRGGGWGATVHDRGGRAAAIMHGCLLGRAAVLRKPYLVLYPLSLRFFNVVACISVRAVRKADFDLDCAALPKVSLYALYATLVFGP